MEEIRQYILSVAAAAILCAILRQCFPEKSMTASLLKLVSGIFLAFVVISPVKQVELGSLSVYFGEFTLEGEALAAEGENLSSEAMARIIKEQTEAYILDKAEALNADISVEVGLSGGNPPVPKSVRITGPVSPYAKSVLETLLAEELGIAKEDQSWTGQNWEETPEIT